MGSLTVGVDFGGTYLKIGCVDDRGRVLRHHVVESRPFSSPGKLVQGIEELVGELCDNLNLPPRRLVGVGVGVPGLVDGSRGVIHRLVNVPGGWRGVPLQRLLERRLKRPCAVDNDVNVIALGEWRHGAGRGTRHSVYLTLGTGVGGGLIIDGKLARGVTGSAGELGHVGVLLNGPRCGCGRKGCLEALVGTAGILRRARAAIRGRSTSPLAQLAAKHGGRLTPKLVSEAAQAGDRAAVAIWQDVGYYLGTVLADIMNLLSPERIVIGGGVSFAWPWFSRRLRATIKAEAFAVPAAACRVVRAQLGERAGVIGAAALVKEQVREA